MKELGLDHNNTGTNKTDIPLHKTNKKLPVTTLSFEVASEENKKLPNIYWIPKLHKHLPKARFIISAPQCSL